MVLEASADNIPSRSVQFAVNQVANPKFTGSSGVWAMAKTYSKYNKKFPRGLQDAVSDQFPQVGE